MLKRHVNLVGTCVIAGSLLLGSGWANQASAQSKVIAKVGNQEITEAEMIYAAKDLQQQFSSVAEDKRQAAVLSALIDIKLLAAKAAKAGLEKDTDFITQMDFFRSRSLHNLYFQNQVANTITDEEIQARYDKEIGAAKPEREIKARHILVKTEDDAREVIAALQANGDFIELAKEKSTGPSGPNGGDLGYFAKGQMVPEFEAAAFGLEDGAFTVEPVKTQFGWHIILKEEEREKPLPKFTDVKEQLRQVVLREKYFAVISEAREAAEIEVLDDELKSQMEAEKTQ